MEIELPLYYKINSKRKILYSLNNFLMPLGVKTKYKNTYYLNQAKKHIYKVVNKQIKDRSLLSGFPLFITLEIYRPNNRAMDMGNFSILEKYTTDAIVQAGLIPDDNYKYITKAIIKDCGVDSENPRAVYKIQGVKGWIQKKLMVTLNQ